MPIKYKWLSERLRDLITQNMKKGVDKLPAEQELCRRYKVSRQTVRQSLSILEKEGLIEKRRGSGTYITGRSSNAQKNVIGILISDDSEYIYPRLLNDINTALTKNGFFQKTFVTGNRTSTEREILTALLPLSPRGLIVEGCKSALPNPNLDLYHALLKKGCHIVFLHNYYPALKGCPYIKDANISGSMMLVNYLVSQGHTQIGGIFKADDMQGIERFQGFMEAMRDARLTVPDERISWFHSDDFNKLQQHEDTSFLKKIVQESLNSCTAVVCYNDMIAYFLMKELKLSGYRLPDEMSIVTFDHTYLSNSNHLALTTLGHTPHEMGTRAVQMLIDSLKGFTVMPTELPWKLIPKESTLEKR